MHWGLIPSWARNASIGSKLINAQCESASDKPTFRSAFRHRRCVIPASGFYEWKKEAQRKQPYYIERADGEPLLLAGLWEIWRDPDSTAPLESCSILTTQANQAMSTLHNRIPAVLEPEQCDAWLDLSCEDAEQLRATVQPAPEGFLEVLLRQPAREQLTTRRSGPGEGSRAVTRRRPVWPGGMIRTKPPSGLEPETCALRKRRSTD